MILYFDNAWRDLIERMGKKIREYRKQVKSVLRKVEKEWKKTSFKVEREIRITVAKFRTEARKTIKEISPMIDEAFTVDSPQSLCGLH